MIELVTSKNHSPLLPLKEDYKNGGEIKYVEIPKLHIGDMTLHNVTAYVTSSESSLKISGIDLFCE